MDRKKRYYPIIQGQDTQISFFCDGYNNIRIGLEESAFRSEHRLSKSVGVHQGHTRMDWQDNLGFPCLCDIEADFLKYYQLAS